MPRSLYVPLLTTLILLMPAASAIAALASPANNGQRLVAINAPGKDLAEQRERFLEAEKALKQRNMERYQTLSESLQNYPLHPYLALLELQKRLFSATAGDIHDMLDAHGDIPKARRLHNSWLLHQGRSGQWATLSREHDGATGSDRLRCLALRAHLKTGNSGPAMRETPDLWRSGYSLPEACDPLLEYWRDQGGLTADLAWTRFKLAMDAGNYRLAGYLRRFLEQKDRRYSRLLIDLHHNPRNLGRVRSLDPSEPRSATVVTHAIRRLTARAPERAADAWPFYRERFNFSAETLASIETRLALILASRFHEDARDWLDSALRHSNDPALYEWRVRLSLRRQDWHGVLAGIHAMPSELREESRWQYWLARALDQKGLIRSAESVFERITSERSFYGFMAADQLGKPYELNHQGLRFSRQQVIDVANNPSLRRARELFRLGRMSEARQEWSVMRIGLEPNQMLLASRMAQNWGWHAQGVAGAIAVSAWDYLSLRFPLAYREQFHSAARERGLDVNWIYAMARQESAFRRDARSHRGAIGLLQLLPSTARQSAPKAGITFRGLSTLLDPSDNIQLGAAHLNSLLEVFDNNRILATAAYNAGEHRVRQWIGDETAELDSDIWVETMPYHETRDYVRSVMAYTVIYGYRRGEPPERLLTDRELACMCLDD